jgi:hypothetical protein
MKAFEEAQMQSMIRDEVGLYWLYSKFDEHAGLIPFPEQACKVLRRLIDVKEIHSFTFSPATSARRLVEHWLDTGRLPMGHCGRAIAEQLSGVPAGEDLGDYVDLNDSLDGQTIIRRSDLIRLMLAERMTVPNFLLADGFVPPSPDDLEYKRAWELWSERDTWANMRHQNDPDKFEKIQAHLMRIDAELEQLSSRPANRGAPQNAAASTFTQKSALQERTILAWLAANGLQARELPKPPAGKSGAKLAAWTELRNERTIFGSKGTFDKAWERLRASRLIADKE